MLQGFVGLYVDSIHVLKELYKVLQKGSGFLRSRVERKV